VDALVRLVKEQADTLVAVVIEPLIQGAAGMIPAPEGYLRRVREVTREHQVLLIADEVAVGFGRTGSLFACAREGVTPDFLCLAKGLTGGYLPLAATLTTDEVFQAFLGRPEEGRTFHHGHTYTGNPLGAAVALANLDLFEKSGLIQALPEKIERLRGHLRKISELPSVGEVRQQGLMAGIELVEDRASKRPFPAELRMGGRVCRHAREGGVLLRPLGDVLVVMPPLSMDVSLLDRLCTVLYNSIKAVLGVENQ
jgi:adenosylmethionine-8-amino-7-oxononanoate aminotransferase